jgi:hypothetical protein
MVGTCGMCRALEKGTQRFRTNKNKISWIPIKVQCPYIVPAKPGVTYDRLFGLNGRG